MNSITMLWMAVGAVLGFTIWLFFLSVAWTLGKLITTEFFARRQNWNFKESP